MKFAKLASYFQKLEQTSSRNTMTEILAELLGQSPATEIDKICYLTQGRVAPLFVPLEFGVADRMMIRAIADGLGISAGEVEKTYKNEGDLGITASKLKAQNLRLINAVRALEIGEVFEKLEKIAKFSGEGSQEAKIKMLGFLIENADPLSVRYLVRIPLAKMRLGFSDMTVLDALSWMVSGTKEKRKEIEKAFNVRPDLGFIAKVIKKDGLGGLKKVEPEVGTPIMMARAERLSSGEEIIKQIGQCAIEGKIDGFRVAVHAKNLKHNTQDLKITLFSRNMENTTLMFPDLVRGVEKQIKVDEAIFEGEAIAYNPKTGEYLPFQETVQRKRKYDIEKTAESVPLRLICFDCLYVDGQNLIGLGFLERRKFLEKILGKGETLILSEMTIAEKPEQIEFLFQEAIDKGLEGVMAKKLDGVYQAGARSWNWIKYKKSYSGKIDDTIDALVMGYDFGQGKRNTFGIGDFLIGVYDQKSDTFKTVAKIGTGLTDEEWKTLKLNTKNLTLKTKPTRYDVNKGMDCDVWVEPKLMTVIKADEITKSPIHTAKLALRFPRLVDFRDDKTPEDATSLDELNKMYIRQNKSVLH
ncbi:MAG: ATP-dependent DNA ligase [Patescibacteria group bacterium]|nr:ATP-dependent DNA ligase [Patescibacteria group bacterium]MCL5095719.1 ATP-dependent DNA ligase [Patescibacteria group bacterium]